jgi:hypothetical protein
MPARSRRQNLERLWIVLGLAYGVFRVIIANATVRKYGVNIWAFAVIEIGSSFPYSLGTARLVGSLVDHDRPRAVRWGVVSLVCYAAPEAFILLTGHDMPPEIYIVIGVILVVLGTIAAIGIVRKVKASRRAAPVPAPVGTSAEH